VLPSFFAPHRRQQLTPTTTHPLHARARCVRLACLPQAEHARQRRLRDWSAAWPKGAEGVEAAVALLLRAHPQAADTQAADTQAAAAAGQQAAVAAPWAPEARTAAPSPAEARVCVGALAALVEGLVAHPDEEVSNAFDPRGFWSFSDHKKSSVPYVAL
jgi:hypothetical protein